MDLEVEISRGPDGPTVTARGDVDLHSSPRLRDAILEAVERGDGTVSVDLSGVPYMDSSGVATLVEGLQAARRAETAFRLLSPSEKVSRVLRMTRLESVFEIGEAG